MNFRFDQGYQAAPGDVLAALCDPEFWAAYAKVPKLGGVTLLDQDRDGSTVRQRLRYRFTGDLSPAVLAVIDREKLTWVEEQTIDLDERSIESLLKPDNYANMLSCSGRSVLHPDDEATRREVSGTIKVRVPFVGGAVERALVSGLQENYQAEAGLMTEYLAGRAAGAG